MSDTIQTYTGVWINWSEGMVRGATLTLSQRNAGVLTAFLAILVSFSGTMFWSILSFIIHQAYTTDPSQGQDALHAQRQVIIRNKGAGAAAWALIKLPFEIGHTPSRAKALGRSLPFALLAILNILLFGASGLLTSYITKAAGNSVIILGPSCGGFDYNTTDVRNYTSKALLDTYEAVTYVRQCYQSNVSQLACAQYVRQSLPFTTNPNASCPFAADLCAYNDHSAFQMDTGLLDSAEDFGVNAPSSDRIKFRRVATCAPVRRGSNLATVQNDTTAGEIMYVNAGGQYYHGEQYANYTFIHSPIPPVNGVGYTLSAVQAKADPYGILNGTRSWVPDPRFNQTDADISIMLLIQNGIAYLQPSYDPWITALIPYTASMDGTNYSQTMWYPSFELNLLVCVDQYQVCNPNKLGDSGCGKLGGLMSAGKSAFLDDLERLGFNEPQIYTIGRFLSANIDRSMYSIVDGRSGAALNASLMAYESMQYYLPPTQWQNEVSIWFSTALAKEQAWAVEWATAPKNLPNQLLDQSAGWKSKIPTDPIQRSGCFNQLVPLGPGYQNYSILGLALTVAICGLLTVVGLVIDTLVGWLRREKARFMRDQWAVEETLALHKVAYRTLGLWRENDEAMPPSSVLLHQAPSPGPGRAWQGSSDEGVGVQTKQGYAVVGHQME
ncbi:hypothetical protein BJX96DRAFT_167478 [Aspergillus floccosus]